MYRRVLNNALWLIICRIIQSVFNLIINMLSARYLGPSNFGLINYAASMIAFVVPIMQLGLRSTLVKELIDDPENEGQILGTTLVMNIISAIACITGIICIVFYINADEKTTIIVCALYSINLIFQALEMLQYWYQSKLLSKYTSIISLSAYIIVSFYKVFLLMTNKNIYWFSVAQAMDYMIIAILLLVIYKKIGGQPFSFSLKRVKSLFSKSRYFIVSTMMITVFQQTDKLMLKNMLNDASVGFYSAAITCAGMTSFIFGAIIDSMRPIILETKNKSVLSYEKNVSGLYSIIFYLSLFQCIFITLFADPIINILYGYEYDAAINVLRIVVWFETYSYFGSVRSIWILAEGKQEYLWIINLCGALINVVLNLILIPLIGIIGAAIASFITQFFSNFIIGFIMKPIRYNNYLILKGINPTFLISYLKTNIIRGK